MLSVLGPSRLSTNVRQWRHFMSKKLDIQEAPDDVWPVCPHCKNELKFIWVKSKGIGFIERKQFLLCPHCRSFLGFGNISYT